MTSLEEIDYRLSLLERRAVRKYLSLKDLMEAASIKSYTTISKLIKERNIEPVGEINGRPRYSPDAVSKLLDKPI